MEYQFTTNSRVISGLLANYRNTFIAFCELVNNALQANASEIKIYIDERPGSILTKPIIHKIRILDDGSGVSESDFRKKIFEIGTDVKPKGKGIGRFAAFQIGSFLEIESVAYDHKKEKYVKTIFPLDDKGIEKDNLATIKFNTEHEVIEEKAKTYYQVKIDKIYDDEVTQKDKTKKIHKNLYLENIGEALFLQYPLKMLNDEIAFYVNDQKLKKEDFVIGGIETREELYIDTKGKTHSMTLSFINYKSTSKDIQIFLRVDNGGIKTVSYKFKYSCDIPEDNGWLVYVDSQLFDDDQDIFRNLQIPDWREDSKHLIANLKEFTDKFFKEKFKDYVDFSKKLKNDTYYPYRRINVTSDSKSIVFNQLAYCIEKEHKILSNDNKIRKIIYPLVDKAINHGDLTHILDQVVTLKDKHVKRFIELLNRASLEDVIQFSEEVARKIHFLDFLDDIIYGSPAKHLKERSQLHKIVEKHLWIFGEQYNDTPILFSDKSLKNNLIELRKSCFEYDLSNEDDNLQELKDSELKDITDLFFFNEKIRDDQKREVMVVELKRPACKISQKELGQSDKYRFKIEESGKFSQEINFKIILISSDLNKFTKSTVGTVDKKNPYLHFRNASGNIETWVIKWSDLIHSNRKKLSYMGHALKTKDLNIKEIFEKEYSDIDISNLISVMTAEN